MGWVNGYKNTTFTFWLDEDDFSLEQLLIFFALIAGSIFGMFHELYGVGKPRIEPKEYFFVAIGFYILTYYIIGGAWCIYSSTFAKFIRLVLLHIVLVLMLISISTFLGITNGVIFDLIVASLIAAILLFIQTRRKHKSHEINGVLLAAVIVIVIVFGFLSTFYLILPWQGPV